MLDKIREQAQRQQKMLKEIATEAAQRFPNATVATANVQHRGEQFIAKAIEQLDSVQVGMLTETDKFLAPVSPKISKDLPLLNVAVAKTRDAIQFIDLQYRSFSNSAASIVKALPIAGYDTLTANQVVQTIKGLSAEEIHTVRLYEANHKNRTSVLKACEKQLRKFDT